MITQVNTFTVMQLNMIIMQIVCMQCLYLKV